ncbi:MAG: methyltransferase domain-containing protein [Acidobacteria bacterium]|nr:methyltransferase domain-containing protein [Acidobacteriota bacterium]
MSKHSKQSPGNLVIEYEATPEYQTPDAGHQTPDNERLDEFKRRAQQQWSANPCGAHVAKELEFGTRDYFDAIEEYRYKVYAPWMKTVIGFAQYSGKRVLEIGCGTGTDSLQFARNSALFTGVDLTPRSIEIARQRFAVYEQQGEFFLGDAEHLNFPDESFDVVYSFGVIHHTPNTEQAAQEIHRVLKPGGKAIVMVYHRASLYYWGGLILKRGLLRGELWNASPAALMSRYVEHTETGGRPLVKAYTRREVRKLFARFRDCKVEVNQLTRAELGAIGRVMPEPMLQWLARHFGWNLIITATK